MPAGRGNLCERCYWTETFRKRLRMDQAAFSVRDMAQAFGEFGEWLLTAVGDNKAALTVHRYQRFFLEMEKQWRGIPAYADLLRQFGAERLRRVRLLMRWLHEAKRIVPDAKAREEDSERRRIEAIMASVTTGTLADRVLTAYMDRMIKRVAAGKATVHSVRLALRPAASLLLAADPSGDRLPDQAALDRYLIDAPGQKAAITGFINFLNDGRGLELVPKVDEKRVRDARRKKLEAELMALRREGGEGDEFRQRWLSAALAYFHGIKRSELKHTKSEAILEEGEGFVVTLGNERYWVPTFHVALLPVP